MLLASDFRLYMHFYGFVATFLFTAKLHFSESKIYVKYVIFWGSYTWSAFHWPNRFIYGSYPGIQLSRLLNFSEKELFFVKFHFKKSKKCYNSKKSLELLKFYKKDLILSKFFSEKDIFSQKFVFKFYFCTFTVWLKRFQDLIEFSYNQTQYQGEQLLSSRIFKFKV